MESQGKFQPPPSTFVGRESELAELRAGLDEALAGHGRLFLISGEPGIGKTRITNELAAYASAAGAKVTWGKCWVGRGTPAYWPWIEIVRTCVGDPSPLPGTPLRQTFQVSRNLSSVDDQGA